MHFLENNLNFDIEFTILTIELSFCTHKLFKVCRQVATPKRHQLFYFVDVINKSLSIGLIFIMIELYLLMFRDANPFWSLSWRKFFKGGTKG